jgi:hypothetical protein
MTKKPTQSIAAQARDFQAWRKLRGPKRAAAIRAMVKDAARLMDRDEQEPPPLDAIIRDDERRK